jgi:lipopolysaccharide export system protein LptC
MLHYPDDDSTELAAPRMVQARHPGPRFTVSAERGVLSSGGDEVFLYDNVLLVRDAYAQRPRASISTSFLHVLPERGLVRTDQPVSIEEERRLLTGRGLEYHQDTSEFILRHDVRARLVPGGAK